MARFFKHVIFTALIIIFIFGVTAVAARAQADDTGIKVYLSSVSSVEKPDSMTLKIYFNLYKTQTGEPILNPEEVIKNAQVTLDQLGFTDSPKITKPDNPIYIVLLLDSSGSMVGTASELKKAANLALDNIPDNSFFSVVQFDEETKILQTDFTDNVSLVRDAINRQYMPSAYKGTCLYDAAYSAVEQLQRPTSEMLTSPGRRAIILFTDGKDENPTGKLCSKHTFSEVTTLASKVQVPINTIGLSYLEGKVNQLDLENMARDTRGFSAIARNYDQMNSAFTKIMNALRSQRMVATTIYPHKGENKGKLTLNLVDADQPLEESISIVSNVEYPGPPSAVTISRANLIANAPQQAYDLHLPLTSPELVDHIEISVKDGDAGTTIIKKYPSFRELTTDNTFTLPTQSLMFNSAYQLSIMAFSKKDGAPFAMCTDQNGKSQTECLIPFNFDASFYPSLTLQPAKEDENSNLLLDINVTKPELVGGFEGWLVDENNSRVAYSDFNIPATQPIQHELTIPLRTKHIPEGKYTLMVRLLSPDGNGYPDIPPTSMEVSYREPSWGERMIVGLTTYWYLSLIILGIIGFAAWFVMKNTRRRKTVVQPPIIAIADDEPILSQGQSSYRSPAKPLPPPAKSATSVSEWLAAGPTIIQDESPAQNNIAVVSSTQATQTAKITVLQSANGTSQSSTLVNQFPFIIGRIEAHLIIKDPKLSRRHAQITYDDARGEYFLTDLGSSNGTYLDDQRLISNQPIRISSGANIKLGTNALVRFDLY